MFIDQATIKVKAGDGGDGALSFRRLKYEPKGGNGGSVIAVADPNTNTLLDFRHMHTWKAQPGEKGRGKQQYGADGQDLELRLPPGTLIYDNDTGELIHDLKPGEKIRIARGGKGGKGNEAFKTPVSQSPLHFETGEPGEERTLRLELKLIADIGLVGKPNAGKSTLLASITHATPKIANYPFTTLSPQLGIAELDGERRLVLADLPGLIEGAADGAGLGHEFLRHIERTKAIVHLIEPQPADGSDPVENYLTIRKELEQYSTLLAEKPEIIAISKIDLLGSPEEVQEFLNDLRIRLKLGARDELFALSSADRRGLRQLLEACWTILAPAAKTV